MKVPASKCPHCKTKVDATSTSFGDDIMPSPGDISICIYCGEWIVFDDGLKPRKPTDDELIEIGFDQGARRVREAWVRITKPQ